MRRSEPHPAPGDASRDASAVPGKRPALRPFTTTLWEYPSQHYDQYSEEQGKRTLVSTMQGDRGYAGATPSWVVWQLLQRYTREGDTVLDPMCGSGTTLDVCADLGRKGVGFDLAPRRPDITRADARALPVADASVDFVFVDPPYSTHISYSDDPACIGRLDAGDGGRGYYQAMDRVIGEIDRVLRPKRYMGLYVCDSWRKRGAGDPGSGTGTFMPIGFELFALLRKRFQPVDIVSVVRHNAKIAGSAGAARAKAALEGNYFDRGFNYLFIMKKVELGGVRGR
jgi:adenine-specific DNA-methyltransferase